MTPDQSYAVVKIEIVADHWKTQWRWKNDQSCGKVTAAGTAAVNHRCWRLGFGASLTTWSMDPALPTADARIAFGISRRLWARYRNRSDKKPIIDGLSLAVMYADFLCKAIGRLMIILIPEVLLNG